MRSRIDQHIAARFTQTFLSLAKVSAAQAHARSDMTGRLVDTYTNISTVKLFSHSNREADYAKKGMEYFLTTVHPQMRLATLLGSGVWAINALLIFAIAMPDGK